MRHEESGTRGLRTGSRAGMPGGTLIAAATPAALALFAWLIAGPVAGVDLAVDMGSGWTEVGAVAVVVAALIATTAAFGVRALLRRLTSRADVVWRIMIGAVAVVSLSGPLTMATNDAAAAVLVGLHLLVAAAVAGSRRTGAPNGLPAKAPSTEVRR